MVGDGELLEFRQDHYQLLVALLAVEPARDMLAAATAGAAARAAGARSLQPLLGRGWAQLAEWVAGRDTSVVADAAADEYTRQFIGPHTPVINAYESHYLSGQLLDRPLARVRATLRDLGVEKSDTYSEPEDFLGFELEVMRRLVAAHRAALGTERETACLDAQALFLRRHLLVWGPAVADDLAAGAGLYRAVGSLLGGFLALERELFLEWGPEPLRTLDEARQRYVQRPEWRGPLLEFSPPPGAAPDPSA